MEETTPTQQVQQNNGENTATATPTPTPTPPATSTSAPSLPDTATVSSPNKPLESVLKNRHDNSPSSSPNSTTKRVQFLPNEKDSNDATSSLICPLVVNKKKKKSKKVTRSALVGKADPIRDGIIILVLLLVFYTVSIQFEDVGRNINSDTDGLMVQESSKSKHNTLSQLRKMRKALGMLLEAQQAKFPSRTDCSIFLAPSSIPHAGLAFFAATNYSIGQTVMDFYTPYWPIYNYSNNDDIFNDPTFAATFWASPHALFLLKHHPTLSNIQSNQPLVVQNNNNNNNNNNNIPQHTQFIATQPIEMGQELFLEFQNHPHFLFDEWYQNVIPLLEDYLEANELILHARQTFREAKGRGAISNKQTGIIGQALRMIQRITERYRPAVAALLPTSLETLSNYRGPTDQVNSLYFALHNQSMALLARHGLCYSDIIMSPSLPPTNAPPIQAYSSRRFVPQGQRVHPMPVRMRIVPQPQPQCNDDTTQEQDKQCTVVAQREQQQQQQQMVPPSFTSSSSSSWCLTIPSESSTTPFSVQLCPMEPTIVHIVEPNDQEASPNVLLKWSTWKDSNPPLDLKNLDLITTMTTKTANEYQSIRNTYMWDLVALRDLQPGEKLILALSRHSESGTWLLPETLMS